MSKHHKPSEFRKLVITSSPLQAPVIIDAKPGMSIMEMVKSVKGLPPRFWDEGIVLINGEEVPMERWKYIKPKETTIIQLCLQHAGGKKGGLKNILALVAGIVLMIITSGIAAGGLASLGLSGFGAGTFAAQAAAALVGIGGQLLIKALFPPPTPPTASNDTGNIERADIQDNILAKGQTLPRIAGTFKIALPLMTQPWSYLQGRDEFAEAVYALAGPHTFASLKVRGTPIEDLDDIAYTIDEGDPSLPRTQMFTKYAKTTLANTVLTSVQTRDGDAGYVQNELVRQDKPKNSLPTWHRFVTAKAPDEVYIRFTLSSLYDSGAGDVGQIVQFRLRIRKVGDTVWKNIPQIFYISKTQATYRREIILKMYKPSETTRSPDKVTINYFDPILANVPTVTREHFVSKTTDPYQWEITCGAYRTVVTLEGIMVYLDDAYFGDQSAFWEFEIKRSAMNELTDYEVGGLTGGPAIAASKFDIGGVLYVIDPFDGWYSTTSTWAIKESNEGQSDTITIDKITSVYYGYAFDVNAPIATIQVKVKNYDFSQLSALTSGLVPTYNPSTGKWEGLSTSSNPADHLMEMYVNSLGLGVDTLDPKYIDNDVFVAWRDACTTNGWEINTVLDSSFADAERMICSCGFARPVTDTKLGVVFEHDTSVETAKQMFTPLNIRELSFSIAYTKRPIGFRIEFYNEANDYEKDEVIINDPYAVPGDSTDYETLNYPGITDVDKVVERALFDFEQANKSIRYTFTVGLEHIASKQGDLAILSHYTINNQVDYFYVVEVIDLTHFRIDRTTNLVTPDGFFDIPEVFAYTDVFTAGQAAGVISRSPAGALDPITVVHNVVTYDSVTNIMEVSDASMIEVDDIIIIGPLTTSTKRVIILDIEPQDQMTARITCMDE